MRKACLKIRKSIVAGKDVANNVARDDSELNHISMMIKEKNQEARANMEIRMGDANAPCSRCGLPIDKGQGMHAVGLQKFHNQCPTKEESEAVKRNTRVRVWRLQVYMDCASVLCCILEG